MPAHLVFLFFGHLYYVGLPESGSPFHAFSVICSPSPVVKLVSGYLEMSSALIPSPELGTAFATLDENNQLQHSLPLLVKAKDLVLVC